MIQVQNLKREFGPKVAVDGVSFVVKKGEVLGFLGPDGAGKSTTMRMITGFIPPSEGSVSIGGFDVTENPIAAKRLFGYVPENAPSYTDMTVHGFLNFAAQLRGFTGKPKEAAVERVAEMCFLGSLLEQSIETLSKGYKHRVCFAQAMTGLTCSRNQPPRLHHRQHHGRGSDRGQARCLLARTSPACTACLSLVSC